jgi:bifunctional ADP-heptose synthase (sugar kinase/adenylyltransferase)
MSRFPPLGFKMNASEFQRFTGAASDDLAEVQHRVAHQASRIGRPIFVTLADRGILGAAPGGPADHVPAHRVRGPIDIVGAGDAVTANLAAALAAGATPREAMELAMAAASIVIHQLGTTGTAAVPEIARLLFPVAVRKNPD